MNISLRIKRGQQRAKASGKQIGRRPVPRREHKYMKDLRWKNFSYREIAEITGYSIGVIYKYGRI